MRKIHRGGRPVSGEPLSEGRVEYLEAARQRVRSRRLRQGALIVAALTIFILIATGMVGTSIARVKDLVDSVQIAMTPNAGWPQQTGISELTVMEPLSGHLACGAVGKGKMPEPDDIYDRIEAILACKKDLQGLRILVTAGPTQEPLDPVRYLTNHSSGKMGYAIAHAAMLRGADVTLVSGPTALKYPPLVRTIPIVTAQDMYEAVTREAEHADIIIKAAAVADYTPETVADHKIKKSDSDLSIPLRRTQDILGYLGTHRRPGQFLCGFSMETEHMLENSRKKLTKKNLDMIVANNVKDAGAGFQGNTNVITMITQDSVTQLPLMDKEEAAHAILTEILARR